MTEIVTAYWQKFLSTLSSDSPYRTKTYSKGGYGDSPEQMDAQFAYDEGEGDRSLNYWREAHRDFFSRVLPKIGKEFSEDMTLVCQRFRLIYK